MRNPLNSRSHDTAHSKLLTKRTYSGTNVTSIRAVGFYL